MIEPIESCDEFDAMLRRAMRARPEPLAPSNLAARAMAVGGSASSAIAELSRLRRINRMLTALAVVSILALATWVIHSRLDAGGFQAWSDTTDSTSVSDTSTTSTNAVTITELMFGGIAIALAGMVVVCMQRTISPPDQLQLSWG